MSTLAELDPEEVMCRVITSSADSASEEIPQVLLSHLFLEDRSALVEFDPAEAVRVDSSNPHQLHPSRTTQCSSKKTNPEEKTGRILLPPSCHGDIFSIFLADYIPVPTTASVSGKTNECYWYWHLKWETVVVVPFLISQFSPLATSLQGNKSNRQADEASSVSNDNWEDGNTHAVDVTASDESKCSSEVAGGYFNMFRTKTVYWRVEKKTTMLNLRMVLTSSGVKQYFTMRIKRLHRTKHGGEWKNISYQTNFTLPRTVLCRDVKRKQDRTRGPVKA
ncbi:hypothetical protein F4604DRAFT_1688366 [Suillus subluteus]|nr:hypothetical protein F4604DRAFT_1688366 [Suillus subluteus]